MRTSQHRVAATASILCALVVGSGVAPAAAKGPPVIVQNEFEFEDVNPCTGEEQTVFIVQTLRAHEFENTAGHRHHSNVQFVIDITTSDGFSGRVIGPDVHNHTGGLDGPTLFEDEEGTGMFAGMGNGIISNKEIRKRYRFHFNFHYTLVKGVPIVDNFTEVLECLGR